MHKPGGRRGRIRWASFFPSLDKRTVDAFRTDCLRELIKIKTARPGLSYSTAKGVLVLSPSKPSIAPTNLRLVE